LRRFQCLVLNTL